MTKEATATKCRCGLDMQAYKSHMVCAHCEWPCEEHDCPRCAQHEAAEVPK